MGVQFEFNSAKTANENFEDFLKHIELSDKVFGPVLRSNLGLILPLPPDTSSRTAARTAFNAAVKKVIETMLAGKKTTHA